MWRQPNTCANSHRYCDFAIKFGRPPGAIGFLQNRAESRENAEKLARLPILVSSSRYGCTLFLKYAFLCAASGPDSRAKCQSIRLAIASAQIAAHFARTSPKETAARVRDIFWAAGVFVAADRKKKGTKMVAKTIAQPKDGAFWASGANRVFGA